MLIDARSVPDGDTLDTDVAIVGAGPAGLTVANALLGSGVKLCVLEAGDGDQPRSRRGVAGESIGMSYYPLADSRAEGLGGTSVTWPLEEGWRARPLDPIDFQKRPGIEHSGWPFGRDELETFYPRAQQLCHLGPYSYDPSTWERENARRLPIDGARVETTIFQLGSTTFAEDAKALGRRDDVRLLFNAKVVALSSSSDGRRVNHIVVRHRDGRSFRIAPRFTVLACGGIENARLLLLSRSEHAKGLGNEHDLVGRFFMERLSTRTGFFATTDAVVARQAALYDSRVVDGARVQGTLRITDAVLRAERLQNCTFFVLARSRAFASEAVRSLATLVKGRSRRPRPPQQLRHMRNIAVHGDDLVRLVLRRPGQPVLVLRAQAEQAPNSSSRISLGRQRDEFGLPRARLDWRTTEADRRSIRRCQEIVSAELTRAGLAPVELLLGDEDPPAMFEGNHHHMGTTRMHDEPRHGVVDGHGRLHGMANLYIAGSSVFPTVGCSNPTLTIVALALRLARHLQFRLERKQ